MCAEDVQRATSAVVLGAPLLDVEEPGQRDFVENLERRRVRHRVLGMWIANDADLGISDRQTIGPKEQRIGLEATGRRRAHSVDVLGACHPGHRYLSSATAADEPGADDHTRRIANHVSPFSFVGAESLQQVEDLRATQVRDLAAVAPELNAELPRQVLSGIRPSVE